MGHESADVLLRKLEACERRERDLGRENARLRKELVAMAKTHKPEPGVERAEGLGIEAAMLHDRSALQPGLICPYSYGTPCFWVWQGAYRATLDARRKGYDNV